MKWSVDLSEFDINYQLRTEIKAKVLADLMVECTEANQESGGSSGIDKEDINKVWLAMVDDSNREQEADAGVILIKPRRVEVFYTINFEFKATNNQAKNEAFIVGLKLTLVLRVEKLKVRTDSQLVANHLNENFQTKDEKMVQYLKCSKQIMTRFRELKVEQIPWTENFRVDIRARMVAISYAKMPSQFLWRSKLVQASNKKQR